MAVRVAGMAVSDAYRQIKAGGFATKKNLQSLLAKAQTTNIDYEDLRGIYRLMERYRDIVLVAKDVAGLNAYAQTEEADPTYDCKAEVEALIVLLNSSMGWMETPGNVPTSVTVGLPDTWGDNVMITNSFTPAQSVTVQNGLIAIIAEMQE